MLTDTELAQARDEVADTYTASLVITTATPGEGGGGWDPEEGPSDPGPQVAVYDGPARVQAVRNSAQPRDAAGQPITIRPYKIALPWDAPEPPIGAQVTVTGHPSDALITRKVLTVTSVVHGDLGIERVIYADLDLTNQPQEA